MNVFFDFNQVLKKSIAEPGFIDHPLLSGSFINQQLIEWSQKHNNKYFIWSASDPKVLQLIKEKFNPLFSSVISSQETGLRKNEVSSFAQVEKLINALPQDCLLIDDQLENTQTAQAAGWQAIHFTSTTKCLRQLGIILA
jgi:FMN phosphatase YigB (HAD superfamily)